MFRKNGFAFIIKNADPKFKNYYEKILDSNGYFISTFAEYYFRADKTKYFDAVIQRQNFYG